MIKKLQIIALLIFATKLVSAQCVAPTCTPSGTNPYCAEPDTITNLPIADVAFAYATDIKINVAATSQGATIINVTIDSITGMPAGFTYTTNPASGIIPGGSNGCINFVGNATAGQETGGPNSDGVYPLTISYTGNATFFGSPVTLPGTLTGYKIIVTNTVGINLVANDGLVLAPNPASEILNIFSGNNTLKNMKVYDTTGRLVKQLNSTDNVIALDVNNLKSGLYSITISENNNTITKRFVKE